jgi:hypothetical protein
MALAVSKKKPRRIMGGFGGDIESKPEYSEIITITTAGSETAFAIPTELSTLSRSLVAPLDTKTYAATPCITGLAASVPTEGIAEMTNWDGVAFGTTSRMCSIMALTSAAATTFIVENIGTIE